MASYSMKQNVVLLKKGTAGVTPEEWVRVGVRRRACIQRLSTNEALANGAAYGEQNWLPTHRILVDKADDYEVGRLLVRTLDDTNFRILSIQEAGKRTPVGYKEMLLIVTELNTQVKIV